MNNYNLNFLIKDIEKGLLKNNRVGMIRRTLKFSNGRNVKDIAYFPDTENFIVLNIKGRFE